MWLQFQSDDLLRANTSHLRIMSKGALPAWIEPQFGIPVLLTSCQKGPQKCPGNWSPMCSLCSLTSLFEVFCLEPSKSWFQTTSRQNAVSWVHGTFAEINYYPERSTETQFETMHERKKRFAQLRVFLPDFAVFFEIWWFSQGKNALTGCWFFCFVRNLNALRARASWQNDSVFWFFRIIFQSKNALFTFLFSVNFTIFVAVVKGDIQKKWIFISKKVYPGITAATKSCFQKMEKVKSGVRIVKKCWNFL